MARIHLMNYLKSKAGEYSGVIQEYFPASVRGTDPEDLHKLRVASRRLRVVLAIMDELSGRSVREIATARKTARRLTRAAGRIRELDVTLLFLKSNSSPIPPKDRRETLKAVEQLLTRKIQIERRRLGRGSTVYNFNNISQLESLRWVPYKKDSILALRMIKKRRSQVRSRYWKISGPGDACRLHRYRIAVKKLRYSAEILLSFLPSPWKHRVGRIKKVQAVLGRLHDDYVTAGILSRVARGMKGAKADPVHRACGALQKDCGVQYARLGRLRFPWMR